MAAALAEVNIKIALPRVDVKVLAMLLPLISLTCRFAALPFSASARGLATDSSLLLLRCRIRDLVSAEEVVGGADHSKSVPETSLIIWKIRRKGIQASSIAKELKWVNADLNKPCVKIGRYYMGRGFLETPLYKVCLEELRRPSTATWSTGQWSKWLDHQLTMEFPTWSRIDLQQLERLRSARNHS